MCKIKAAVFEKIIGYCLGPLHGRCGILGWPRSLLLHQQHHPHLIPQNHQIIWKVHHRHRKGHHHQHLLWADYGLWTVRCWGEILQRVLRCWQHLLDPLKRVIQISGSLLGPDHLLVPLHLPVCSIHPRPHYRRLRLCCLQTAPPQGNVKLLHYVLGQAIFLFSVMWVFWVSVLCVGVMGDRWYIVNNDFLVFSMLVFWGCGILQILGCLFTNNRTISDFNYT